MRYTNSSMPKFYDAYTKPLGTPTGPGQESEKGSGKWIRRFNHSKGVTLVHYDSVSKIGTVQWAGDPPPPPTPVPAPVPTYCTPLSDTTFAYGDVHRANVSDWGGCCSLCHGYEDRGCTSWAFHATGDCHCHKATAQKHVQKGTTSGFLNSTSTHSATV
jgi:hypothetical protein